jgi:hypothetical protein
MHFSKVILFLGNAWDLSSALMLEKSCHVLSLPGLTNCNKLKELGVRRFSFGNALSDKVIAYLEKNAVELLEFMDTSHLYEN